MARFTPSKSFFALFFCFLITGCNVGNRVLTSGFDSYKFAPNMEIILSHVLGDLKEVAPLFDEKEYDNFQLPLLTDINGDLYLSLDGNDEKIYAIKIDDKHAVFQFGNKKSAYIFIVNVSDNEFTVIKYSNNNDVDGTFDRLKSKISKSNSTDIELLSAYIKFGQFVVGKSNEFNENITKNVFKLIKNDDLKSYLQNKAESARKRESSLQNKAIAGDITAIIELARLFTNGSKFIESNFENAKKWATSAAEMGKPNALFLLGKKVENGKGFPKDRNLAMQLYYSAAVNGSEEARNRFYDLNPRRINADKCVHLEASRLYNVIRVNNRCKDAITIEVCTKSKTNLFFDMLNGASDGSFLATRYDCEDHQSNGYGYVTSFFFAFGQDSSGFAKLISPGIFKVGATAKNPNAIIIRRIKGNLQPSIQLQLD